MSMILTHWPLSFVCAAMILAAVIDGWKLKVPNWLTFPLVLSGWALGLYNDAAHGWGWSAAGDGGIGAALAGTGVGFALLLPIYAIGGMGAGDVKMQMGFGSWIGAFFSIAGGALWIILWAFFLAVLIGGIIALGMIIVRRRFGENLVNAQEILGDLLHAKGISEIAEKAAKRKSRLHLLPYGIPLCLGFISCLLILEQLGKGQ